MPKDPLEAERDFRQRIKRAAESRRQSQRSRKFFGILALPFKLPQLTLLLVILVGVGSFFIFILGVATKWTNAYACTLAEARRSPVVIAELGEPIEAGFFAWGNWEKGTVTEAFYRTTLAGPKGKGTLRVQLYSAPIGSSLRMYLDKDGRTQQVYGGPTQCR
jgi:Cytochrome oxidase complex assembly protein 1